MITWLRTARIHDGEFEEAFAWAAKVAEYLSEAYDPTVEVRRNVGGWMYEVHWVSHYDSLADLDEVRRRLQEDDHYAELVKEAREAGLFIGTSISDYFYETVYPEKV